MWRVGKPHHAGFPGSWRLLLDDDLGLHPGVDSAEVVQHRAGGGGDNCADRLVRSPRLNRQAVAGRIQSLLALVQRPVDDRIRRRESGRLILRVLEVPERDSACAALIDLRGRSRQLRLRQDRERVRFVLFVAEPERKGRTRRDHDRPRGEPQILLRVPVNRIGLSGEGLDRGTAG